MYYVIYLNDFSINHIAIIKPLNIKYFQNRSVQQAKLNISIDFEYKNENRILDFKSFFQNLDFGS